VDFTTHLRVLASSFLRFRHHTQWHTTVDMTPLDEWSARRRDLYLTNTQHSQQTNIHAPGGIQTCNASRRAAADPRLRPLGHWDRLLLHYACKILQSNYTHSLSPFLAVNFRVSLQFRPIYKPKVWINGKWLIGKDLKETVISVRLFGAIRKNQSFTCHKLQLLFLERKMGKKCTKIFVVCLKSIRKARMRHAVNIYV
jgi:hypothetical protein